MTVFTVEKRNASDYYIDGAPDPTLSLVRGQTYTFDFINDGHPFFIKSTLSPGTFGRYDAGVMNQGSSSAELDLIFTVPEDAPDILYYQCSSHPSMNGELRLTSERVLETSNEVRSTVSIIVAPGQLGSSAVFLDGITEVRSNNSWTLEYAGNVYAYADIDAAITTVIRDDAYTDEFANEITESYPEHSGITLAQTIALVGSAELGDTLILVANADGNIVG